MTVSIDSRRWWRVLTTKPLIHMPKKSEACANCEKQILFSREIWPIGNFFLFFSRNVLWIDFSWKLPEITRKISNERDKGTQSAGKTDTCHTCELNFSQLNRLFSEVAIGNRFSHQSWPESPITFFFSLLPRENSIDDNSISTSCDK